MEQQDEEKRAKFLFILICLMQINTSSNEIEILNKTYYAI